MEMSSKLADTRSYMEVLGCLQQNIALIHSSQKPLSPDDFNTSPFCRVIFCAMYNLYMGGAESVDSFAVDSYLSSYPTQYKIFSDGVGIQNGVDWMDQAKEVATIGNYDYFYHRLKKFSLLRFEESRGLDTRFLYNPDVLGERNLEEEKVKFDKMTEADMLGLIKERIVIDAEHLYNSTAFVEECQAGEGTHELIDSFRDTPDYGYAMPSPMMTTISKGCMAGKFLLFSADTGVGKTRTFLMNAVNFAVPYKWDKTKKDFVYTGHCTPTLYWGTEGSLEEFQTIVLAAISGVPEDHIRDPRLYEVGEYERAHKAADYLNASPLYIMYADDYSVSDIENMALQYQIQKGIEIFIFDYLQSTPKLIKEYTEKSGMRFQEYQILRNFSSDMKKLAQHLKICVISGTQLAPGGKEARYKDNLVLQGSKAVANKIDFGVVLTQPNEFEKKKLEAITAKIGGLFKPVINILQWVYKCRGGKLTRVILCGYFNRGTMEITDYFVVDFDFNLINIDVVDIDAIAVEKAITDNSKNIAQIDFSTKVVPLDETGGVIVDADTGEILGTTDEDDATSSGSNPNWFYDL